MMQYQRSHPWISFSVETLRAPHQELWAMLGECQSKCEHIAGVPLEPEIATQLHSVFLAKGVHGTTAIEGNTLSEQEVLKLLERKLTLPPSREYLVQEVQNVIEGLNFVVNRVMNNQPLVLSVATFEQLNKMILDKLELADDVVPGKIRKNSVGVMRYRGAPAEDCDYLLDRLGQWLGSADFECPPGLRLAAAILKAVIAHLYLAWIHPFGDGNGRTARLVEFDILFSSGVPAPAAHLLSNHYNMTRTEYYRQLDYSSKSRGDIFPFVNYAVHGLLDGLREQLAVIRSAQLNVIWRNHVYRAFDNVKSQTQMRRRNLVLDLSRHEGPVPFAKLREISQRTAVEYSKKTKITLIRDLNALKAMDLIVREKNGTRAKKEVVEAFLPIRASIEHITVRQEESISGRTAVPNLKAS